MRELNSKEVEQVDGGYGSALWWLVGGALTIMGAYDAVDDFGDGFSKGYEKARPTDY